jgi:hypothetical protein
MTTTDFNCAFEKVITSAECVCEKAVRYSVAERLGVRCASATASTNCHTLRHTLRYKARFALKVTHLGERLPFGKELQVMVGGLFGLQAVLAAEEMQQVSPSPDIYQLICRAQETYGSLADLPYDEIVRTITRYRPRRRSRSKPR